MGVIAQISSSCQSSLLSAPTEVFGCTDPTASNYNPSATVDDGSCTYPPPPGPYDAAAQAYFDAVEAVPGIVPITITQKQRYNAWVVAKKAAGTYSSYLAVFPFYGGIEAAHKINAIDLTTGTFMGGWIHSTSGATPNGTTAYLKTAVNPKVRLGTVHTFSMGVYSRTDIPGGIMVDLGCEETAAQSQVALYNGELPVGQSGGICNYNIHAAEGAYNSSLGYALLTRESETSLKNYRSASLVGSNTTANSTNLPDKEIYAGAYNNNGTAANFSIRQLCWIELAGAGLDATAVTNDNILIEGIQESFNRGVQ